MPKVIKPACAIAPNAYAESSTHQLLAGFAPSLKATLTLNWGSLFVQILENYKPNNARLEVAEIIINVCNGVDDLMMGSYLGTDRQYRPSIRKCYFSKKDIEFTDEMFENLRITEKENHTLKEENALYLEIFNN